MVFIRPDLVERLNLERLPLPVSELVSVAIDAKRAKPAHTLCQIMTVLARYCLYLYHIDCCNCTKPLYAYHPGAAIPL
jgi:hypothetical protein